MYNIKTTNIPYCQSCGKDFRKGEIVYYAKWDNDIVCQKCSVVHREKEKRIFQN
ncbi:hypothetical protein H0A61_02151 [Koleobacter methoxysyntrophicus]|uniref:Uncharacterized protein n=1 Tax=Koleobacter methoxysyntrophicus TaxID=2751313 RepID=A0A8A0RQC1_9FIRM|nr:hypothetical protein [Koleobacter methoxysyntrophicus]QSQ09770.1 hypothetical protein H0A61_02151 [Koleobacter methoxysyntrophicus]